ncbi:unnamed protein product [Zymoseptoria tritici ST99CH_1E4]|uniref:DUF3431 domain-containing protein n=1 Tax=Zymoseptoria tritici ST99CH_1E4 TaxID=1276532 RepID=A0A2H1FJI3_ZYMTR|nr:unnamed protein product [Zymoseptoria tritici ST99CH_1E4]
MEARYWHRRRARITAIAIAATIVLLLFRIADLISPNPYHAYHDTRDLHSDTELYVDQVPLTEKLVEKHAFMPPSSKNAGDDKDGTADIAPKANETPVLQQPATNYSKTIVMGKVSSEDTDWVATELPDWDRAIYVVDLPSNATSPTGLRTKLNKAREANPYLTFIIENYDNLPDIAVFLHAHRNGWPAAWHNDANGHDAVVMLKELQLATVEKRGYVNLRCIHDPGCPRELDMNPPGPANQVEDAYPHVYAEMFNMTVDAVREQVPEVGSPCCAQFAVTRAEILKRPKSDYEWILAVLERSELEDYVLGRVMEYTWHILFGRDAVYCEDHRVCWREVYGRPSFW